ncbi:hypothetical protein ES332_A05G259200v1 [Gossypium tomentosum]|uniref:Uncharacterized protein n=1 Tax=Gossypium tomentosum TaxID=34277 RepID=A0A5D2QIZ5_GOSTO|nr:hypothetical protein ES332_A05G259200v1 [Gossypium tomentosum]
MLVPLILNTLSLYFYYSSNLNSWGIELKYRKDNKLVGYNSHSEVHKLLSGSYCLELDWLPKS